MNELEMAVASDLADALKGFFEDEDADEDAEPPVTINDVTVDLEEGLATLTWSFPDGGADDDEEGDEDE